MSTVFYTICRKIFYKGFVLENIDIQIGERLKQARLLLGFNKAVTFSAKLGLENQTYGRYEKGERGLPDGIKLQLFKMGVNISWLITGQGTPLIDNQIEKNPLIEELRGLIEKTVEPKLEKLDSRLTVIECQQKKEKPVPAPPKQSNPAANEGPLYTAENEPEYDEEEEEREYIPYVHEIAAGPPITQNDDPSETVAVPAHLMKQGRQYYAASIRGDSMTEAGIRNGDMILIRYTDTPRDGAIQVVRYQNKSTLKLLREIEGGGWELHYRDGSGRIITCDSAEYETQGEFEAILPKRAVPKAP